MVKLLACDSDLPRQALICLFCFGTRAILELSTQPRLALILVIFLSQSLECWVHALYTAEDLDLDRGT